MASDTHFTPSNTLRHFMHGDVLYVVHKEHAQIDNSLA